MVDNPSPAEQAVTNLNALRTESLRLDDYMRNLRLGRKIGISDGTDEVKISHLQWLAGVYGFGWLTSKAEDMPDGMSHEFYQFLSEKKKIVSKQIRDAEYVLQGMGVPQ